MTTTSVKNVGSVMNLGVQSAGASARSVNGGFQTVWNNQTNESQNASQQDQTAQRAARTESGAEDKAKPGDDLKVKDSDQRNIQEDDAQAVDESCEADAMTEEELEAAMEVIMSSVTELVQQIADTFEIPVEAVQDILSDMDLQPIDLLQPENLSSLLLQAGGAQDSMTLLTDEELYADYQMLMEQGKAVLEADSETLEMTPEQLLQTVADSKTVVVEERQLSAAEIVTEDDGTDSPVIQMQSADDEPVNVQTVQNAQESADRGGDTGQGAEDKPADQKPTEGEGNLVLQTIRSEAFRVQTEEVQPGVGAQDVDAQDMMRQIMDYMKIQVRPDVSRLEMQLHPANLGTLQIQIAAKGGMLTANFITQNEAVKAALEGQMVQLKESFEEQGVKVEAIEVTVQTHQFEQNLEQGRGRQYQEQSEGKRPRTRRITLDGLDEAELPEMEAEDRITAEMMAANGTTVDFTA